MTPIRERMGITLLVAYLSTGLGQILNQAFFFLILRSLTVQSVGSYSWAVAIATIYAYVMDFGLAVFLVGELSKTHYRLRTVVQLILFSRAPLVVLGCIGLLIWAQLTHPTSEEFWTLTLVTLTYVIQLIDVGLIPWFQVRQRQNAVNLVAMLVPLGRLVGIAVPLLIGQSLRLPNVVAVLLVTQMAGTAGLFVLARSETRMRPEAPTEAGVDLGKLFRGYWDRGRGLAVMYSLNILQARLDWILVSAFISKVALANYSLANKIIEMAMLVAGIWARTSFPWQSRHDAAEIKLRARLVLLRRLFVVASGVLTVVLFFWSVPLVNLFFGAKYLAAELSIRLMTLGTMVFMLNQFLFYMVLGLKKEGPYTLVILAATVAQVLVDSLLLPRIGISGAAIGMMVMGGCMHLGQIILLKRNGSLDGTEILHLEVFLGGLTGSLILAWWCGIGVVAGTCVALILVVVAGGKLVLRPDDRAQIRDWLMARRAGWFQGV
jgi:O-antigen/teichoic acid export membrane protein